MIIRQKYLDQLTMYLGSDFIKILTGARRVGKSTMLLLLKQHLINKGAKEEQL